MVARVPAGRPAVSSCPRGSLPRLVGKVEVVLALDRVTDELDSPRGRNDHLHTAEGGPQFEASAFRIERRLAQVDLSTAETP